VEVTVQDAHEMRNRKTKDNPILSEIVRRLVKGFKPSKIYLFGSRAKGTEREGSDYDLLIVLTQKMEPTHTLSRKAGNILSDLDVSKDILFTSLEKFERRKKVIGALAEIAFSEGKELYAA